MSADPESVAWKEYSETLYLTCLPSGKRLRVAWYSPANWIESGWIGWLQGSTLRTKPFATPLEAKNAIVKMYFDSIAPDIEVLKASLP